MSLPDLDDYRPMTKNFDLTDQQKDELILAVWRIVNVLMDQAFGVPSAVVSKKRRKNSKLTHDNS